MALDGILFDVAVQADQVFSQKEIYELRPQARSRINSTVYMLAGRTSSS